MYPLAAWAEAQNVGPLVGVLLATAVVGIRLARFAHIPRVVGYLLLGLVLQLIVHLSAGGEEVVDSLLGQTHIKGAIDGIKSFALCLILFAIGAGFDAKHLRAIRGHIWKLTLAEVGAVGLAVFVATWAMGRDHSLIQAVFLAIAAIATAPAATMLVLRQYGAKGPTTDHILAMTGMNNLVAIVLFYAAFLIFAELGPDAGGIHAEHMDHGLVQGIVFATVGSAVIGFLLGLLLSLGHVVLTRFESLLVFLAFMLVVSVEAEGFGLNGLIICMFMGLAFTNFSIQPHQLLTDLEPISAPVFALFFVLAGFNLKLARLLDLGALGVILAFLVARTAGKVGGAYLGVRWVGPRHRVPHDLGMAMLCQAGVAIGLGKFLVEHWGRQADGTFVTDPGALAINTVILASVAVFELTGPLATKRAAVRAGEVKAVTLIARPTAARPEISTIIARLKRAIAPAKPNSSKTPDESLTARHVMRTNVESLADTAKMVNVLHFVEHSRLNHFYVVDAEGHFIGTVNFRDLRNLMFNPVLAQMLTAYDMANTAPPIALADQPLKEILDLFHEHDVGSLPVIENRESRRLLGVIEQRDVLRALHVHDGAEQEEPAH